MPKNRFEQPLNYQMDYVERQTLDEDWRKHDRVPETRREVEQLQEVQPVRTEATK